MQSLRIKFGERRSDWTCCLCCHVRTGTIFLGVYHLLTNMLALSVLSLTMHHPELFHEHDDPILPTPLSEIDDENMRGFQFNLNKDFDGIEVRPPVSHKFKSYVSQRDWHLTVFYTLCSLGLSLMLLYGAVKRKPTYLMPFFGFQVFNFCVTCMAAIGYICYQPPTYGEIVKDHEYLPFKEEFRYMSPQTLNIYLILAVLLLLMIKAYFLNVIWCCYKYLTLRNVATARTLCITQDNQNLIHTDPLPDYETAIKKSPTPPPSYSAAVMGQPPECLQHVASASNTAVIEAQVQQSQPWMSVRVPTATTPAPVDQV